MDRKSLLNDGAAWLAAGSLLLAIVLPVHGPTYADLSEQMQNIAHRHGQWAVVHWSAALALVLLTGAGFIFFVETLTERRTGSVPGVWLLFAIGSLLTIGTAVLEATVFPKLAESGDLDSFVTWWRFSSGLGNGFMVVALATACIAWAAAKSDAPPMPGWLCWAGAVLALLSAIGWSLGQHFALSIGGPLWFAGTLLMALWLAWFGFRSRATASQ